MVKIAPLAEPACLLERDKEKSNLFKSRMSDKVADVEASIDQIPFLSVDIRDPGVCYFNSSKADIFRVQCLCHDAPPYVLMYPQTTKDRPKKK